MNFKREQVKTRAVTLKQEYKQLALKETKKRLQLEAENRALREEIEALKDTIENADKALNWILRK